jgi:hypothetical protein
MSREIDSKPLGNERTPGLPGVARASRFVFRVRGNPYSWPAQGRHGLVPQSSPARTGQIHPSSETSPCLQASWCVEPLLAQVERAPLLATLLRLLHSPVCMLHRAQFLSVLAGAAGGAVAIATMEVFSARTAFPRVAIPFATSIVTVLGSPKAEPAQPRALMGGHLVSRSLDCWSSIPAGG